MFHVKQFECFTEYTGNGVLNKALKGGQCYENKRKHKY